VTKLKKRSQERSTYVSESTPGKDIRKFSSINQTDWRYTIIR